jgi:hypothetical protein
MKPPRLVRLAPAQLGRADALLRAQGNRRTASAHAGTAGTVAKRVKQAGIEAWFALDPAELLGDEAGALRQDRDTLDVWFDSGVTHACVLKRRPDARAPGRPVSRRLRPASRLVPVVAAHRLRHRRPRALQGAADPRLRGRRQGPQDEQVERQRHRAAEGDGHSYGADILRLWVASYRLLGRAHDLRRNPEARGGRLPPHPQHAALPARQPVRFRPAAHAAAAVEQTGWKSTATRWR